MRECCHGDEQNTHLFFSGGSGLPTKDKNFFLHFLPLVKHESVLGEQRTLVLHTSRACPDTQPVRCPHDMDCKQPKSH